MTLSLLGDVYLTRPCICIDSAEHGARSAASTTTRTYMRYYNIQMRQSKWI